MRPTILIAILTISPLSLLDANPLTNADITRMFKNGIPESVIVGTIKANNSNFNVSPDQLISLKKAGIPAKIMEAMVEIGTPARNPAMAPAPSPSEPVPAAFPMQVFPGAPTVPSQGIAGQAMPGGPEASVVLIQDRTQLPVAAERLQSVKTTAKTSKLTPLLSAGVQEASNQLMTRPGMGILSGGIGMLGGLASRNSSGTSIYLWGLPGASSFNVVAGSQPKFEITFAGIPGVNPDEFEPRIVKLNPTKDNWRLLGITQSKETPTQGPAPQWPSYSSFREESIPAVKKIVSAGDVTIVPEKPLSAGQYAVVLRPAFKNRQFSAEAIMKNQGEGALFNSAWSFTIQSGAGEPAAASSRKAEYAHVDSVEYRMNPSQTAGSETLMKSMTNKVLADHGAAAWEPVTSASGVTTYTSGDRKTMITIQTAANSLLVDLFEQK